MISDWRQHPEAEEELARAAEWYERRESGVGYELMRSAEAAIDSILDPTVRWGYYRDRRSDPQIYSRSIVGFPLDVIYLMTEATVVVVAFAHERRLPGYWMHRIADEAR